MATSVDRKAHKLESQRRKPRGNNRYYLLLLLMLILAFNHIDRQVLSLLLEEIKAEFSLSDTQLGLLTGVAFAIFYSTIGIPIARWADRGNRVKIIALTTTFWSAMVALCGAATNFAQLLLARIGVAVGEAGCVPPANSLIPDHFSREERPRASSIYLLGVPLSVIIGYLFGGWLNEFFGWRWTFVIIAAPGILLGVLAFLTLREPRLSAKDADRSEIRVREKEDNLLSSRRAHDFREVLFSLWRIATFRELSISYTIAGFFGYGISIWLPAFFIRSHHMDTGELGTWLALTYGVVGAIGTYAGGAVSSRLAPNREERQFKVLSIIVGVIAIVSVFTYLTPNKYLAIALMSFSALSLTSVLGPTYGAIQSLVPVDMRAMAVAILLLLYNLIGMGLGPLVAGIFSDLLRGYFQEESLRYSLVIFAPGYVWMAVHLWRASRTVERDLQIAIENEHKVIRDA